jgi:hypothetical protein
MGLTVNFEFDLYPVKEVFGGFVVYPLAHGKQALSAYSEWTRAVPDTLTSAVRLVHYPPAPVIPEPLRGASAIVLRACFTGSTTDGEALLEPLRSIGTPLLDTFKPMPYAQIAAIASDPTDAPPLFTFTDGGGLRDLSSDVIDALLRIAGDPGAGIFIVEARHAGGALARRPEDAMPFGFRSPWFISALAAAPTPQALEVGRQSVAAWLEALKPALTGEVLLNSHARNEPRAHRTFEPTVATRALEQLDTRLQSQFRRCRGLHRGHRTGVNSRHSQVRALERQAASTLSRHLDSIQSIFRSSAVVCHSTPESSKSLSFDQTKNFRVSASPCRRRPGGRERTVRPRRCSLRRPRRLAADQQRDAEQRGHETAHESRRHGLTGRPFSLTSVLPKMVLA